MKARKQYKTLTKVVSPPVATVRKFIHLLDQNDADFEEELKTQQLKESVSQQPWAKAYMFDHVRVPNLKCPP